MVQQQKLEILVAQINNGSLAALEMSGIFFLFRTAQQWSETRPQDEKEEDLKPAELFEEGFWESDGSF